jgi:hypothetical protein
MSCGSTANDFRRSPCGVLRSLPALARLAASPRGLLPPRRLPLPPLWPLRAAQSAAGRSSQLCQLQPHWQDPVSDLQTLCPPLPSNHQRPPFLQRPVNVRKLLRLTIAAIALWLLLLMLRPALRECRAAHSHVLEIPSRVQIIIATHIGDCRQAVE